MEAHEKDNFHIGAVCNNIPELKTKNPHLAPMKPLQYNYEDAEVIQGQDYYHAIRPVKFLLGEDSN